MKLMTSEVAATVDSSDSPDTEKMTESLVVAMAVADAGVVSGTAIVDASRVARVLVTVGSVGGVDVGRTGLDAGGGEAEREGDGLGVGEGGGDLDWLGGCVLLVPPFSWRFAI